VRARSFITAALSALVLAGVAGCGQSSSHGTTTAADNATVPLPQGHPQVVQPVAGAAAKIGGAGAGSAPTSAGVSVETPGQSQSLPQPQPISDIRKELAQSGQSASTTQATLTPDGLAVAPIGAPAAVQAVIAAGNEIARLPYR
jgi:hypothetical protein